MPTTDIHSVYIASFSYQSSAEQGYDEELPIANLDVSAVLPGNEKQKRRID